MSSSISLPGSLVTPQWLHENLGGPNLVILDATVPYASNGPSGELGLERWREAHIPGSRYAALQSALSDPASPFGFTYPGNEAFAEAMEAIGVGDDTVVVIYDDFLNMWATRIWWMLRAIGFERAAVLNGGLRAWRKQGLPLSSDKAPPVRPATSLTVRPRRSFTDLESVLAWTEKPVRDELLVCALPESYFTGVEKVGNRGGHIPGSINLPASSLLDEDGRFLPPEQLGKKLEVLLSAASISLYCGGGISATIIAFALSLLGRRDTLVYDGSLEEWNSDATHPLVSGAGA
ncbi:sulfurtransferase [Agrobacterium rhizogenes]|nr:sulfurtransferase [Rhizobium rhizogenes]NTG32211.1 sulfurtransferase [Rhizobium rhizogenes]